MGCVLFLGATKCRLHCGTFFRTVTGKDIKTSQIPLNGGKTLLSSASSPSHSSFTLLHHQPAPTLHPPISFSPPYQSRGGGGMNGERRGGEAEAKTRYVVCGNLIVAGDSGGDVSHFFTLPCRLDGGDPLVFPPPTAAPRLEWHHCGRSPGAVGGGGAGWTGRGQ